MGREAVVVARAEAPMRKGAKAPTIAMADAAMVAAAKAEMSRSMTPMDERGTMCMRVTCPQHEQKEQQRQRRSSARM